MSTIISRPLISPLIHDDSTRLFVIVLLALFAVVSLYKIFKYYGK